MAKLFIEAYMDPENKNPDEYYDEQHESDDYECD